MYTQVCLPSFTEDITRQAGKMDEHRTKNGNESNSQTCRLALAQTTHNDRRVESSIQQLVQRRLCPPPIKQKKKTDFHSLSAPDCLQEYYRLPC